MMFNKFITPLLLAFSIGHSFADDQKLKNCANDSLRYGSGKGQDSLSIHCYNAFKDKTTERTLKQTSDNKKVIFGHKNTVFIETIDENKKILHTNIIAGVSTLLNSIVAISVDETNNEIIVLEGSGDILFFSSILTGNVAPLRVLRNKELHGSSNLVIAPTNGKVIVYNKASSQLLFFSRKANFYGREGKKNLSVLKMIKTSKISSSKLSINDKNVLIVEDLNEKQSKSIPLI